MAIFKDGPHDFLNVSIFKIPMWSISMESSCFDFHPILGYLIFRQTVTKPQMGNPTRFSQQILLCNHGCHSLQTWPKDSRRFI
jgi:hypothetical protein